MKKSFSLIIFLFCCVCSSLASSGTWRSHFSYHDATQCVALNGKVYVVSDGSLYSYSVKDGFVECYDKSNGLCDRSISYISVCEKSKVLLIIYENANIDLMRSDGSVVAITDYANETSLDPKVNGLCVINGQAYLATNFGVVVLNVEREEFGDTYMFSEVTYSCVELNGMIYTATENGLYCGDMSDNLLDIANWSLLSGEVYVQLAVFDNQLFGLKAKESVYCVNLTDGISTLFRQGNINFMHCVEGKLVIGNKSRVYVYTTSLNCRQLTFDGTVNSLTYGDDTYWTCNGSKGLNGFQYDKKNNKFVKIVTEIIPNSPIRNYCQYLSVTDEGRLLVAGGCLNYFDKTF